MLKAVVTEGGTWWIDWLINVGGPSMNDFNGEEDRWGKIIGSVKFFNS